MASVVGYEAQWEVTQIVDVESTQPAETTEPTQTTESTEQEGGE
ncbi:hypothetical protein [Bifidobacterium sp. UBA4282]|nr:hypothetical protein [Bifidobacterium sp. UBA4282]